MGQEEQIEEREVLDSIFPDEITDISETSYRVAIKLDIPRQDDDETKTRSVFFPTHLFLCYGADQTLSHQVTLLLTVSYPPSYPDTAPDLDISLPVNTPKHVHFDLSVSRPILLSSLPPLIADSLGSAMIFTLISHIKEFAEQLVLDSIAAEQEVADAEKRKVEEEEDKKFSGRRVTRESFGEWRLAFKKEVREREEEEVRRREEGEVGQGKKRAVKEDKLSGRELWERGLVGKIDEDEEGLHPVGEGMGGLKIGGA